MQPKSSKFLNSVPRPYRVGIAIAPMELPFDRDSLANRIVAQNTSQSSILFELVPVPPSLLADFSVARELEADFVRADLPHVLEAFRHANDLPEDFPIVVLSDSTLRGNAYKIGAHNWSLVSLGHWLRRGQEGFAELLFASCALNSSVIFAYVPELKTHQTTRGCLFDYNRMVDDAARAVHSGFVCPDCESAIEKSLGRPFVEDVKQLAAIIAEDAQLLANEQELQQPIRRNFVAFLNDVWVDVWSWFKEGSMKRLFHSFIWTGVMLIALDWTDIAFSVVGLAQSEGQNVPLPITLIFAVFFIVLGVVGWFWAHYQIKSAPWKKHRDQLISNLTSLIDSYGSTNEIDQRRHVAAFEDARPLAEDLYLHGPGAIQQLSTITVLRRSKLLEVDEILTIDMSQQELQGLEKSLRETTRLVNLLPFLHSNPIVATEYEGASDPKKPPRLAVVPLHSSFMATTKEGDDSDPKYASDGRGFWLSGTFKLIAGHDDVAVQQVELLGYHQGLHLSQTTQELFVDSRRITEKWLRQMWDEENDVDSTHFVVDDYRVQPEIVIRAGCSSDFVIKRLFYPPFHGVGAPYDYRAAELELRLGLMIDSTIDIRSLFFSNDYCASNLVSIEKVSDVPEFSDTDVRELHTRSAITAVEARQILSVPAETRARIVMKGYRSAEDAARQHDLPFGLCQLLIEVYSSRHKDVE